MKLSLPSCNSSQVLPLANDLLYKKLRMRAVEIRRQGQGNASIVLTNVLKPALFAEFVLPYIHVANSDQTCSGPGNIHTRTHSFLLL